MAEQLQVAEILFDPEKDKDLTAEYTRFRELTKELATRPEDFRMGSANFAKVVFFLDHYSRMNLWSEFFPIPPEKNDPKKQWRSIGESLVGKEPLDSKEKQKMDPSRFASTLQELVSMDPASLERRLIQIRENLKMDPTALFASQYAEAIKLRRDVDPVLGLYENLKASYLNKDFSTFNETVAKLRKVGTERAGEDASTLEFEKIYNGVEPFYRSSVAYVLIFLIAGISWLASTIPPPLAEKVKRRACCAMLPTYSLRLFYFPTLLVWQVECISKVAHLSPIYILQLSSLAGVRFSFASLRKNISASGLLPRWAHL